MGYLQSKNIDVYYVFPNYIKSEYEKNEKAIKQLEDDLLNDLMIEIISTPEDFIFDDNLFFDSIYHLNKKGREIRTDKLIEVIKKNKNALQSINKIGDYSFEVNR